MKNLIVALDLERNIGKNGSLPWHLPDDLKRFKQLTINHPIIMGRKTFESIGRPLPTRENIVLSRQVDYLPSGCVKVSSLAEAFDKTEGKDVFVIGGENVFRDSIAVADSIHATVINTIVDGADVCFPPISLDVWSEVYSEEHLRDDRHEFDFCFKKFVRRKSV